MADQLDYHSNRPSDMLPREHPRDSCRGCRESGNNPCRLDSLAAPQQDHFQVCDYAGKEYYQQHAGVPVMIRAHREQERVYGRYH